MAGTVNSLYVQVCQTNKEIKQHPRLDVVKEALSRVI